MNFHPRITAGALCGLKADCPTKKRNREKPKVSHKTKDEWQPGKSYRCVQEGEPLPDRQMAKKLFQSNDLEPKYMYIFANVEPQKVNEDTPRFEAVFYASFEGKFFTLLKEQLRKIYEKLGRNDLTKAHLVEDGLPYWVDRFIVSETLRDANRKKRRRTKKEK